jgi:hypothetical protein
MPNLLQSRIGDENHGDVIWCVEGEQTDVVVFLLYECIKLIKGATAHVRVGRRQPGAEQGIIEHEWRKGVDRDRLDM